jgi:hypothetical protein
MQPFRSMYCVGIASAAGDRMNWRTTERAVVLPRLEVDQPCHEEFTDSGPGPGKADQQCDGKIPEEWSICQPAG